MRREVRVGSIASFRVCVTHFRFTPDSRDIVTGYGIRTVWNYDISFPNQAGSWPFTATAVPRSLSGKYY
jgi:hypothetical protein